MKKTLLFLILTALLSLTTNFLSATNYSFNISNGNWNVSTNWLPNGVPTTGDNVTIGSGKTLTLDLPGVNINNLTLIGTLQGINDLNIGGDLLLQGTALLDNQGATTVGGFFDWQGGSLGLTGSGTITLGGLTTIATTVARTLQNRTLVLNGGGTWSSGNINMLGSSILRVPVGQTLSAIGSVPLSILSSGAGTRAFEVLGQLLKTNTNTLLLQIPVAFSGVLDIQAGILDLVQGGTLSNTISFAASSVLKLSGGTLDVLQDMAMAGKVLFSAQTATMILHLAESFGSLEMLGGILTLGGNLDVIGDCIMGNGTLNAIIQGVGNLKVLGNLFLKTAGAIANVGNVLVEGAFEWIGGTLGAVATVGGVVINGVATIGGAACTLIGRTFTLVGGGEILSGTLTFWENAIMTIPVGSILRQLANLPFAFLNGDLLNSSVEILGTLLKSSTNLLTCSVKFALHGTLSVTFGILRLTRGAVMAVGSVMNMAIGTILELTGGIVDILTDVGKGVVKALGAVVNFLTPSNLIKVPDMEITSGTVNINPGGLGALVNKLTISGGTLGGTGDLEVLDDLIMSGGEIARNTNIIVDRNFTWSGGQIGNLANSSITDITVEGTSTIGSGQLRKKRLILNGGGTLAGGTIDLNDGIVELPTSQSLNYNNTFSGVTIQTSGGAAAVNIKGTLTMQNGFSQIFVPFNNTGLLVVNSGSLYLRGGGTNTGSFTSNAANAITFYNGTHTLNGSSFSGTGSISMSGGIVNSIGGSFSSTIGAINLSGATFNLDGTVIHTGDLNLQGGLFAPLGNTFIGGNLFLGNQIGVATALSVTDMTVTGLTTIAGGSIVRKKLILNGGGTSSGGIGINDGGILEIPATKTLTMNSGLNSVEILLSGTLNIKGIFRKQGPALLTIWSPVVNTGEIIVESGALTIKGFNATMSSAYSGNGSINLASGTTLDANWLNYSNPLLTNNGTIVTANVSGNAFTLNGTTQQTIAGNGTIDRLKLNNTNGYITTGAQTVTNSLTISAGKIQLGNSDFTLSNGATMTGFNANNYFQTNSTGNLKMSVGSIDALFPVGGLNYAPVTIKQASGTDVYAVRVSDGIDPMHPLNGTAYVAKEWDISRTPSNVTAATVKAEWNAPMDEGVGFTCASAQLLHYNGTIWEALSTVGTTLNCAASPSVRSLTRTNVTSFSPFAVGLPSVVLSVELIDFQVVKRNSSVDLLWQTASEKDMSHFDIEQSVDGKTYSKIGQTKAAGKANRYIFTPEGPLSILTYFRLKIINADGSYTYSKVVSVSFGKNLVVKAFPNPVNSELTIDAFSDAKLLDFEVVDIVGRSVYQKKEQNTEGSKSLIINTLGWSSGIYVLKVTDGKNVFQEKIVKR